MGQKLKDLEDGTQFWFNPALNECDNPVRGKVHVIKEGENIGRKNLAQYSKKNKYWTHFLPDEKGWHNTDFELIDKKDYI